MSAPREVFLRHADALLDWSAVILLLLLAAWGGAVLTLWAFGVQP